MRKLSALLIAMLAAAAALAQQLPTVQLRAGMHLIRAKVAADYETRGRGLMFRKDDPQLAALVDRRFAKLASSRELRFLYEKWFQRRLPTGERLNIPISPQLAGLFQALGLPE